jgi:uncharacterized protein (UPF0264 family)
VTGLLVSVRSASEADSALSGGATIIDVKEPGRGSLGAADPEVWAAVIRQVGRQAPVSVALGELHQLQGVDPKQFAGAAFVKVGLAGSDSRGDWRDAWASLRRALPEETELVGVIYADWLAAAAPHPSQIIDAAEHLSLRTILIDTFQKSGGTLFDLTSKAELDAWCQEIRRRIGGLVLAGSLTSDAIGRALELRPDLIAVRGAASGGNRTATISRERVAALVELLRTTPPASVAWRGCAT